MINSSDLFHRIRMDVGSRESLTDFSHRRPSSVGKQDQYQHCTWPCKAGGLRFGLKGLWNWFFFSLFWLLLFVSFVLVCVVSLVCFYSITQGPASIVLPDSVPAGCLGDLFVAFYCTFYFLHLLCIDSIVIHGWADRRGQNLVWSCLNTEVQ